MPLIPFSLSFLFPFSLLFYFLQYNVDFFTSANFTKYSNPWVILRENYLTAMLNFLIILLATNCVATGNLDSKQTGDQITVGQPDTEIVFLWNITFMDHYFTTGLN